MWTELLIISQITPGFGNVEWQFALNPNSAKLMPHVCSYPDLHRGTQSPHQSCNWRLQGFCSRLGRYPIGFGPVDLMKALCKWVHLMIQLNMIKKNKATHIHMLSLVFSVGLSFPHTHACTHTHRITQSPSHYPFPCQFVWQLVLMCGYPHKANSTRRVP